MLSRRGFTLIELIVVLIIVATLAGLVLPNVSMLGRSSDMAASASSQRELANNLQMFFVLQKRYPQGFDSLLIDDGSGTPTELYGPLQADLSTAASGESDQAAGLPISGPSLYADLEVTSITGQYARSLTRSGLDWVYDHSVDTADGVATNNSGIHYRELDRSNPIPMATVADSSGIAERLLPGTGGAIPTGSIIVAVGIGPNNTAIGKTMNIAPMYAGNDNRYYGRYVAFFQVFDSGERAVLLGVSDAYGRTPDYVIQQFNESLPNGSRQG